MTFSAVSERRNHLLNDEEHDREAAKNPRGLSSQALVYKMADFKFNFSFEGSNDKTIRPPDEPDSEISPLLKSERQAKEIVISPGLSTYLSSRVEDLIFHDGSVVIKHVSELDIEDNLKEKEEHQSLDILTAVKNSSDLIPSIYEGGMKIWECSLDLVDYLIERGIEFEGKRVLEIGCGAGLPGIFAVLKGAKVDFQDYNEDVIRYITIPNVLTNLQQFKTISEGEADSKMCHLYQQVRESCRFFCGDWGSVVDFINPEHIKEMTYDIVLTSETIYSVGSYHKLYNFIKKHVKKPIGVAYVAAKTHYFGVGGGTRSFEEMVMKDGEFKISVSKVYNEGVQREILCMQHRKEN